MYSVGRAKGLLVVNSGADCELAILRQASEPIREEMLKSRALLIFLSSAVLSAAYILGANSSLFILQRLWFPRAL